MTTNPFVIQSGVHEAKDLINK